jgi:hypothetical protein
MMVIMEDQQEETKTPKVELLRDWVPFSEDGTQSHTVEEDTTEERRGRSATGFTGSSITRRT